MKRYVVYEYIEGAEDRTDNVVGYVEAEDPFEACEKLGFSDPAKHFARQLDKMEDEVKFVENAGNLAKRLLEQITAFVEADNKAKEQFKKDRPCPNCGEKMTEEMTCKKCGFGEDEIAIGGQVVTKKMFKEFEKQVKKAQKKAQKKAGKK